MTLGARRHAVSSGSEDYYRSLVSLIETLPLAAGELIDATDLAPALGSRADQEAKQFPDVDGIAVPLSLGAQALEHAADHMWALSEACTNPVQPFAAFTLARGVLESAALAVWLFDQGIDARERVARSLSVRHAGLEEQAKMARSSPITSRLGGDVEREIDNRMNELVRQAERYGIAPGVNDSGRVRRIGSRMPTRTELARKLEDGEADYRLFSAVTHGHSWALLQVGFRISADRKSATREPKAEVFTYACLRSIEFFSRALWDLAYLYGWRTGPFARLLESTYDTADLANERRFWRRHVLDHA